jgi:hypothetical protein
MYDSLLDDTDAQPDQGVNFISSEENVLAANQAFREPKVALSSRELKGNFGKN